MLALGHDWSSATPADLADVRVFLLGLRKSLLVEGELDRDHLGSLYAAMASAGISATTIRKSVRCAERRGCDHHAQLLHTRAGS